MKNKHIHLKSSVEIARMRESGKLLAELLGILATQVAPGVFGDELEETALRFMEKHSALPSFKGYSIGRGVPPFPSALCFSLNDEIVHGFPFGKEIKDGDLVSIDCGVQYHGYHSDSAITVAAGSVSPEAQKLLDTTQQALYAGIRAAAPGARLGDVGAAVQAVAESAGFSVVRDLVGHGVGRAIHESPEVPNYGVSGTGLRLREGMVIAIEPMVNAGTFDLKVDADDWTIRTADGKLAAHFEHTVAITARGAEILTLRADEKRKNNFA